MITQKRPEILVIDDINEIINVLDFSLTEGFDFIVHKTTNIKEALSILKKNRSIQVVIVDVHLKEENKDEDGLTLCEIIRCVSPCKIIVVMTGYASLESLRDARFAGADDYLAKPFVVRDLVKIINENLVKIRRWQKELNGEITD